MQERSDQVSAGTTKGTNGEHAKVRPSGGGSGGGARVQLKSGLRGQSFQEQSRMLAPRENSVQNQAAAGVAGSGSALPHLGAIQASFGSHDVTGVSAHVGGAAREASEAIGAKAYAMGERVAFESPPDIHTAAHEAAHVVQQKRGVSLSGGVGQAGDAYEQHADRVADAVVAGRSAEALLSESGGGATERSAQAVQFLLGGGTTTEVGADEQGNETMVTRRAKGVDRDVVRQEYDDFLATADSRFETAWEEYKTTAVSNLVDWQDFVCDTMQDELGILRKSEVSAGVGAVLDSAKSAAVGMLPFGGWINDTVGAIGAIKGVREDNAKLDGVSDAMEGIQSDAAKLLEEQLNVVFSDFDVALDIKGHLEVVRDDREELDTQVDDDELVAAYDDTKAHMTAFERLVTALEALPGKLEGLFAQKKQELLGAIKEDHLAMLAEEGHKISADVNLYWDWDRLGWYVLESPEMYKPRLSGRGDHRSDDAQLQVKLERVQSDLERYTGEHDPRKLPIGNVQVRLFEFDIGTGNLVSYDSNPDVALVYAYGQLMSGELPDVVAEYQNIYGADYVRVICDRHPPKLT